MSIVHDSRPPRHENFEAYLKDRGIPFTRNRMLQGMIALFAVFWGAMAVAPTDRIQWLMENILVFVAVIALSVGYGTGKLRLSNLSYLLIFLFLCVHTFAAHYTYQNTPFDMWLKAALHTKRSYFDRVVHFAFGCAWIYPIREIVPGELRRHAFWLSVIPLAIVFGFSSVFEIIEMIAAALMKQAGQQYLGLQGDVFDTQKDMALGLLGGLTVTIGLAASARRKHAVT
jgi:putative membrane protein